MSKQTTLYLIAILGLMCLAPVSSLADESKELKAASDSIMGVLRSAIEEKETDRVLSVLTSEAALITTRGRVIQGQFTMKTSLAAIFFMAGDYEVDVERFSLSQIDSVGYETGMYTLRQPKEDGTEKRVTGRFTLIWRKEDGSWKIHRAIGLR